MDYKEEYKKWADNADDKTKCELSAIKDEDEIKERFYKHLEFGTGGLRGIMAAGNNRMNTYVIKRATKGLANYINNSGESKSVAIAYDSRNNSRKFAFDAADILTSMGITAYIFESLRPTPELSYAVRFLGVTAGIVITASHNPSKYNGYKVYWSDGGQIPPAVAEKVLKEINKVDMFEKDEPPKKNLLKLIGKDVDIAFINDVYKQALNREAVKKVADKFKLIYTPLHGSGNIPVRTILNKSGFKNVIVVKEQELPDGNFPTVKTPNPEDKDCFRGAIELAEKNDVNLIIGTDPDCDRVGIVVRNKAGEYITLNGNQVGIMLTNYILSTKQECGILPENGAVVTTIVSTNMADAICRRYGVKLFRTLTGFKFIGEKIHEFEINGDYEFQIGFEESYGYLAGTYCRDKDAVLGSMLIAEMAAYYYDRGMTLFDVMQKLYDEFGGYSENLVSYTLDGEDGLNKIAEIMSCLRKKPPQSIGDIAVKEIIDYAIPEKTHLPKSNVLKFKLKNDVDFVIRPSGTEPKIKLYFLAKGRDYDEAVIKNEEIRKSVIEYLNI